VQLSQPDPGDKEAGGNATRRSQKTPQCGNGQMVGQTGESTDADARPKKAQ